MQVEAVARSRTHQQLLRRSLSSWQLFVKHRQQKATADAYAASRLQQRVFLAWVEEACQARSKAHAAVNMAARVQARMHNQLLFQCFAAWRAQAQKAAAIQVSTHHAAGSHRIRDGVQQCQSDCATPLSQPHIMALSDSMHSGNLPTCAMQIHEFEHCVCSDALPCPVIVQSVVLGFSTKRLRAYLLAWQQQARMLSGAARLLRRLLAVTVRGAFQEWRTVAQQQAHWHRVGYRGPYHGQPTL